MSDEKGNDRARAQGTVYLAVSAFPEELYKEWKEDCQKRFGDCHWIKLWHDHVQTKQVERLDRLESRLVSLEEALSKAKEEPAKKEEVKGSASTFGGTVKPRGDE